MENVRSRVGRRALLKSAAMVAVAATAQAQQPAAPAEPITRLGEVPLTPSTTITVERRSDVALIGINRPSIQNRIDPPTRILLAQAFYRYEHDPSLRALVLFGHGPNFSRGIDVDAAQTGLQTGQRASAGSEALDILGNTPPHRTKPVVVAVHGDTWNLGHEIYLACDVRIASENTNFGQDENTHGRFPGGGATVRFVREAGWGNAMRYMLTGDHWTAAESLRMGITQQIAPTPAAALEAAIVMAQKIAACGPLGVKATLASAHQVIDPVEADALSKLGAQYAALYRTEDFIEGRKAEAEGRPPRYQGK
jgi:enoyl-CoA hydratase/carnithine racemase